MTKLLPIDAERETVHPVRPEWAAQAHMDAAGYRTAARRALADPHGFWREQAARLDWTTPFTTVKDTSFALDDFRIRWFSDGRLNVAANCLDRHLETRGDTTAIIWEGDDPATTGGSPIASCTPKSAAWPTS